jgi:hypothetical protein
MEVCATDEINPNLSSAQVSRINGDHIEAIRCAGKQGESCSDWQNPSVAEGRKRVPSDGLAAHPESLQSVLIAGAFLCSLRQKSYQRSGMGAHYAAHPLHKRWSELAVSYLRLLVSARIKIAF